MRSARTETSAEGALGGSQLSAAVVVPVWLIRWGRGLAGSAWILLPLVAAAFAVFTAATSEGLDLLLDERLFTTAGCQVLTGHVAEAYSNPALQSGPIQNTLYCAISKVTPFAPAPVWFGLAAAAGVVGLLGGLRLARRRAGLAPSQVVVAVAGAYIALWAIPTLMDVHSAEVLIPVMWVAGALLVRRYPLAAGLVLGATAGVELWGIVAIPLVLAADSWRRRLTAGGIAAAAGAVLVLPFALAGHLAMFHFKWPVQPHTLPALIWPVSLDGTNGQFGLGPRLVQVVLACAGCALVAYRVRGDRGLLLWAPATAAEFLRLLIDPTMYSYYWVVPELLATIAVVCAASTRQRVVAGALAVLAVAGALHAHLVPVGILSLLLVGSAVLGSPLRPRPETPAPVLPATT